MGRLGAWEDLGAAGIASSASEMASRGGVGLDLDITKIPLREQGMEPFEIMISESQERMLVVVERGREAEVEAIFQAWDLTSAVIGHVTDDRHLTVVDGSAKVASLPIGLLTDSTPQRRPVGEIGRASSREGG